MNRRLLGVAVAGLAVAVAAESATYLPEESALAAADASVGLAFVGLGVVASTLHMPRLGGVAGPGWPLRSGRFSGKGERSCVGAFEERRLGAASAG